MKICAQVMAVALALSTAPVGLHAQVFVPPTSQPANQLEPSDNSVLLPPQMFDTAAKAPNTTREKHGEWTIYAGVYLIQPVFASNPAFVVTSGGNLNRQVDFRLFR